MSPSKPYSSTDGSKEYTCPYAVALHRGSSESPSHTTEDESSSTGDNSLSGDLIEETKRLCPAFEDSCPFSNAKSAEDVRRTLLKIPASHYADEGKFSRVVKEMHRVREKLTASDDESDKREVSKEFNLPGGCPVMNSGINIIPTQALESYSLSIVMACLAKQTLDDDERANFEGSSSSLELLPSNDTQPQAVITDELTANATEKDELLDQNEEKQHQQLHVLLSNSLKTGTAASHAAAEDVHFVRNFIKGKIDRDLYKRLVVNLYHVYAALEEALETTGPRHFAACYFPKQLNRTDALLEDLDFWYGLPDDMDTDTIDMKQYLQDKFPMTAATRDYVERIRQLAAHDSSQFLLLAHAYTRYLGDLSGGRILARVACKALRLDSKTYEGLAFYQFEAIGSPKRFKDSYRKAMDELQLSAEQITNMVAEANVGFMLNIRIFEELDVQGGVPFAKVRPLEEALAFALKGGSNSSGTSSKKCPFADLAAMQKKGGSKASLGRGACPFGTTGAEKRGVCPWPFILLHDFQQGMRDWKTWLVIGILLSLGWSAIITRMYEQ